MWLLKSAGFEIGDNDPKLMAITVVLWFACLPVYWWIFRFFGIPPLFIFAPACPHCHKKPGGWWTVDRQMPKKGRMPERITLACGLCHGKVELWLRRRVPANSVTPAWPSYRLRWPEFLGIWRRLPAPDLSFKDEGKQIS